MRKALLVSCFIVLLCFVGVCQAEQPHLTPAQGDNDLWGYKNEAGEWVFEPQWRYAGIFRDGVAVVEWARTEENFFYTYGILREDGTWILPRGGHQIYDRFYYEDGFDMVNPDEAALIGGREEGFIEIWSPLDEDQAAGFYCIPTSTLVMPCWNEVLFSMNHADNVLILVCDPETYLWGYVDWYGEVVIPCQYEYGGVFVNGFAEVSEGTGVIDLKGNSVDVELTLESVEEIHKEGLQVTLAAQVKIDSKGTGPVTAFEFFEKTPIGFSEEPMEQGIWFKKGIWNEPCEPLQDGVHTLYLTSPWGIDYAKYIEKGHLCGKVNCGAWVDVEIDLSE
ncbi:MAG: WG repeat-containing protein [Clostridia bacterium]|nr:WG repeat-containing protein [Clostridia bacterium]